jgi:hypothetical protein
LSNVQPPSEVSINARLCLLPLLASSKIKNYSERHVDFTTLIK